MFTLSREIARRHAKSLGQFMYGKQQATRLLNGLRRGSLPEVRNISPFCLRKLPGDWRIQNCTLDNFMFAAIFEKSAMIVI